MIEFEIEIRQRMGEAVKEDRDRFFQVADTLQYQPKYKDKLAEIETIKQQWRDITVLSDYPNITFPLSLPDWFPKVHFASCWGKDKYIADCLNDKDRLEEFEKLKELRAKRVLDYAK